MHNILILGGSGFIGKNLLSYMNEIDFFKNNKKLVISSRDLSHINDALKNFEIYKIKLEEIDRIKILIKENDIKTIVHLVSGIIPASNENDFRKEIDSVINPTIEIFTYAAEIGAKVLFISSGGTIYKNNSSAHKETENLDPINFYGKSKVMIEEALKKLKINSNLEYITLRPSNVYGNFYNLNRNQGLIPNTINNILNNQPVTIWGDGLAKRDYLFAEDLCKIICQLIHKQDISGEFNIASSSVYSVLEVVKLIESKTSISANIQFKDSRNIDAYCSILDTSKIKRIIDFKPHNLDYGLDNILKNIPLNNE